MNREYKIAEIKAKYTRENMLDKVLDYIEKDYDGYNVQDLLNEILALREHGCNPLNKYSDNDLAEELVDFMDRYEREWEDNDDDE